MKIIHIKPQTGEVSLICINDKKTKGNKKGKVCDFYNPSLEVASRGIEPPSKL